MKYFLGLTWLIFLILLVWMILMMGASDQAAAQTAEPEFELEYLGRHRDTEWPQQARDQVEPLLPRAIARAESLMGMSLDRERVNYRITDIPARRYDKTNRMATVGKDEPVVIIYLESLIRGEFAGPDAVLTSLTHETIHALVRQRLPHQAYADLPEWFQEGIAVFLCDQGREKLTEDLAFFWADTDTLSSGFTGNHQKLPYVTGNYFFAELEAQVGRQGMLDFVNQVIEDQSLDQALAGLPVPEAEMWAGARRRCTADVDALAGQVGPHLQECMLLYRQGSKARVEAMACLATLMREYPGTYAAEYAHYWYAKCAFHRGENDLAREYLAEFESFDQHYGLLDDMGCYRFLMDTREAIERHLDLFPDGDRPTKVRGIHDVLRGRLKPEERKGD